jgi:hypothetical protein
MSKASEYAQAWKRKSPDPIRCEIIGFNRIFLRLSFDASVTKDGNLRIGIRRSEIDLNHDDAIKFAAWIQETFGEKS